MKVKYILILMSILQLTVYIASAQDIKKKQLTVKDYALWHSINLNKLSSNGQWVSYSSKYSNQIGRDTLFLKNTKTFKVLSFPGGKQEDFINDDWFSYYSDKGLQLVDLKKNQQEEVVKGIKHEYAPTTGSLLILVKGEKENVLMIRNLNGASSEQISGVLEFTVDPTKQVVLYTSVSNGNYTVNMFDLKDQIKKIVLCSGSGTFRDFAWHINGKAVAFIYRTVNKNIVKNNIYYYTITDKKLHLFDAEQQIGFPKDSLFISDTGYKLKISDDMKRVFFSVQAKPKTTLPVGASQVQVWNGNAKWVYPMEEMEKVGFGGTHLALWRPLEATFLMVSNDTLPKFMLTGDQRYAILSNPKQYEPQYSYEGDRDFYLVDLSSGKSSLFLKKQFGNSVYTIPSPTGKYITYFRDKNWWIYDINNNSHTNITKNLGVTFFHNEKQRARTIDTYPTLGWTTDDKEIVLCDEYDIWAISPDGKLARRLTQGRESQTEFRLAGLEFGFATKANYNGAIHQTIDLKQGLLLLETKNQGVTSGYYKLSPKTNEKLIFSENSRLNGLIKSTVANTYAYLEQRFDLPPRIMIKTGSQTTKILVQSNPQHQQFLWGRSELIQYKNVRGEILNGVLYYPANYDSQKKYPMIVYIYERLSKRLHDYINPSQFTGQEDGFNITNFTTQGYFVFTPDISYEIGNVGVSATDCVVSATKEVINRGLVKADKIGLIGHSFGGYETNFIITQTNLFAAAISGSGWSDLPSAYLTLGWNTGRPDMWRLESQQLRMEKSLFEDREGYRRNSPLEHVDKIKTPLLSWTGNEDLQVNWSSSIQFYLALRRLNKKHIMLLYPKEAHSIRNKENLLDLSVRTHQWFGYHLNDEKPADWILEGTK